MEGSREKTYMEARKFLAWLGFFLTSFSIEPLLTSKLDSKCDLLLKRRITVG